MEEFIKGFTGVVNMELIGGLTGVITIALPATIVVYFVICKIAGLYNNKKGG